MPALASTFNTRGLFLRHRVKLVDIQVNRQVHKWADEVGQENMLVEKVEQKQKMGYGR